MIPDEWLEPSATGSAQQCVDRIRKEFDYGADALIMHGATPDELAPIVDAYRASSVTFSGEQTQTAATRRCDTRFCVCSRRRTRA